MTNSGLPTDGLTPNQGELLGLARLIGMRMPEATPFPGGARITLVEEEIRLSEFDETRGRLANLGSSFKAVCTEMAASLESHHQRSARLFLDTVGGYYGASTLRLQQSSSRTVIGEHKGSKQPRPSSPGRSHREIFPDRTPAVHAVPAPPLAGSGPPPASAPAAAPVGSESDLLSECSA